MSKGLRIPRRYTEEGRDPYSTIEWTRRDSRITNPDGSVVFEVKDAEVPASWSQVATDIIVSKYFRKAGVPQTDDAGDQILNEDGSPLLGSETSSRQVFDRLATTWRWWGEKHSYFASTQDAQAFEDEMKYMLANQIASPNSPQWFNTGLAHAYGIRGTPQGFWFVDPISGEMTESPDSYSHPAPHACFINGVNDDLVNPGGIMDLWVREARLFKMGSGTGSNFSQIRAENEKLSGGGKSSGVMGFLRIGDRAAGAIKCLHADTEIVTDEGTFRIKDVEPGDRVMTRLGARTVTAVHDNGVLPLVKITTAFGDELLCTPEHRFWVRGSSGEGWKEAKEIACDDFVAVDVSGSALGAAQALKPIDRGHHNEIEHDLPLVLGEPFALWLGWMTGDGSITTASGAKFLAVQIGDKDPELLDRYKAITKAVFGPNVHIFVSRRGDGRTDASASVRFSSSQIIRFLEANGLRKGRATETSVPRLVKSSPAAVQAAYVSGLFEADGHIDNGYPVLSSVSHRLALDVHRLLLGLGIPSIIKRQDIRTNAMGVLPIYLLRVVGGEGVRRFAKLVGFISERKSAKLDAAVARKADSPYETQWVLPYVAAEIDALWQKASPTLRRALAPYSRYARPRSLSLLRASALMARFGDALTGSIIERFAAGNVAFQRVRVESAGEGPVFDLTVEDAHEYSVHGLVTHNSGGTTRRAAKMVILDLDHPDVEEFIDWKMHEEEKARVLIQYGGYPADFNGEAYATVSGQNSNNSVRVPNEFIEAVRNDDDWQLVERTNGKIRKTMKARDLWRKVAEAAWACADPGVQFDTIINEWHTSPAGGWIRATNPCSEYVFLDNTACNLASINLVKFFDDASNVFDTEGYEHAIRLWTIALEISVTMAHFPSREIAQGSYDYRTLGLGYANLGTLLMRMGLPYDSDAGRAVSGAVTAILTGYSYATSAELSAAVGPFPRFAENREAMLRVIRNHRRASYNTDQSNYEGLSHYVMGIISNLTPANLLTAARQSWDLALDMGERHGFRNAQVTVIAPTGCLVGGSLVPTERGLVRLGRLGDPEGSHWQDLDIKVGTDEGPMTASQFYINGIEPVVTIETARGYRIQGTPTHRIKVVQPSGIWVWKRFAEIRTNDLVPLQVNQLVGEPHPITLPVLGKLTPDLAGLIGLAIRFGRFDGDGFRFVFRSAAFDVSAAVTLLAKRQFGIEAKLGASDHSVTVELGQGEEIHALAAMSAPGIIPDQILASNDPDIYRAFAVHFLGYGQPLESRLAREVQALLLAIGQPSLISRVEGLEHVLPANGDTTEGFLLDRVASANLGEEQLTYDLSVPENVTYVANGFVSHNTIGLQMDCDTTGVEPDFSLVKFKKLAGGGYFKIVNQSVTPALENLGYSDAQIEDIVRYIVGTSSLVGAPYVNRESLMEKGFTDGDMVKIEATLPAVFELRHAFNPFVLGEATMQRLGFEVDEYATFEFDLLRALGFTAFEVREATEWVCGQQTIEGAPHLKDEHLAVFDTANRNGRSGQRLIHHTGHIKMLAATQPFLSGAASKTINLPNEATIEDIEESYMMSYELGVKCMALYRDGSKASQPLSSSSDDAQSEDEPEAVTRAHEIDKQILWGKIPVGMSPTQAYDQGMHPPRFLLPARRGGYTQEARIGGHKVYLRTGEYQDGTLGELFIDLAKEGATLRGILSCFAIAVSKGLQFGVPLEEFVDTFTFQTFEPRGLVEGHPNIKMANSIVDYVFRALAVEYLKRDDLAQVPPNRDGELPEPASGLAIEAGVQLDLTDAVAEQDVVAVASAVKFLDSKPVAPVAPRSATARKAVVLASKEAGTAAMQSALGEMMGDAPICDVCGHITIRNGSCYKCLNCGNSLGCS